jgi:hypothetical protein
MSSSAARTDIFLEVLASGLLVLGLAFLCAALITHCINGFWIKTCAVVYATESRTGLRWHSPRDGTREAVLPEDPTSMMTPGTELTIYYRPGKPADVLLNPPHRPRIPAAAGALMTLTGAAASLVPLILHT